MKPKPPAPPTICQLKSSEDAYRFALMIYTILVLTLGIYIGGHYQ